MNFESTLKDVRSINQYSYNSLVRSFAIGAVIWVLNVAKQNNDAIANGWNVDTRRFDEAMYDARYWLLLGLHTVPEFELNETVQFGLQLFQREQSPDPDAISALPKEFQGVAKDANVQDAKEKRHFAERHADELAKELCQLDAGYGTIEHRGFGSQMQEQMAFEKLHGKVYEQCERQAQRCGRLRGNLAVSAAADVTQLNAILGKLEQHIGDLDRSSDNGIVSNVA